MNNFTTNDWDLAYEKIQKAKSKSFIASIGSIIAILAIFFIPISFLPRSGRITSIDKSLTFFEYSNIFSAILIIGLLLFDYYFIFHYLKYFALNKDYDNGLKITENGIINDFYDFKDLDEDKIQVIVEINGKEEKFNLTKEDFYAMKLKKKEAVTIDILPTSRQILSINKSSVGADL